MLIYGSYVNGTANSRSDVDCYFIPKTERGYSFAADFMIDGVGYDIFPISWERVGRIADLQENLAPLVGDVQIIYSNSKSDTERFLRMQERMKDNLANDVYVKKIAVRKCEEASRLCALLKQQHKTAQVRRLAGLLIMTLADTVAADHHSYYHFGLKKQYEELQNLVPEVPKHIVDGYRKVVEAASAEDVVKYAVSMYEDVCRSIGAEISLPQVFESPVAAANKIDAACLAQFYEEVSATFQKVYVCCESGNYILACLTAVCLQQELDGIRHAGCPVYYKDLCGLSETVRRTEEDFVQFITQNGGHIKKYDSFEQFEAAKL